MLGVAIYTDNTEKILKELHSLNYKTTNINNMWNVERIPYNGINVTLKHVVTGQQFELQFHTPESHEVARNELHELYEKMRVEQDHEKWKMYQKQMQKVATKIEKPKGVNRIRNNKKGR